MVSNYLVALLCCGVLFVFVLFVFECARPRVSDYVSLSLFLCLCLSASLHLCLSVSVSLSLSQCVSVSFLSRCDRFQKEADVCYWLGTLRDVTEERQKTEGRRRRGKTLVVLLILLVLLLGGRIAWDHSLRGFVIQTNAFLRFSQQKRLGSLFGAQPTKPSKYHWC